jgi:hypothetical protein
MRSGFDHLLLHVQTAKRTFYTAADMDYRNALDHMTEVLARLSATEDAKEDAGVEGTITHVPPTGGSIRASAFRLEVPGSPQPDDPMDLLPPLSASSA